MPLNKRPVILLVGHGKINKINQVVDIFKYSLVFPTAKGEKLFVFGYNMIVSLMRANTEDDLITRLRMIEELPSTVVASANNKISFNFSTSLTLDLSDHNNRTTIAETLEKARKKAQDSQNSWEVLEHSITSAVDIFTSPLSKVVLPNSIAEYQSFDLLHLKISSGTTFVVSVNTNKIENQVKLLSNVASTSKDPTKTFLDDSQVVHMTPKSLPNNITSISLSDILKGIVPQLHVIALKDANVISVKHVCLSEVMQEVVNQVNKSITTPASATVYDFTFPEDTTIIWGACRDEG